MKQERVLVAMSGGVDSSLTAALLAVQGYDVIGATMRLSEDSRESLSGENNGETPSGVADAQRVADVLGIPHYVFDFTASFEQTVIGYFLDEYQCGRTPNPCIVCNRHIKFGALLRKGEELGAQYIATGHYARVERGADGIYRLRKGQDTAKDQSYVLYHLNQETLARVLLPLGNFSKDETRRMAEEEYHLPVAHKAESQEICFVPHDDYKTYLRKKRPAAVQRGEIVDQAGNVLGVHEGISFYTIGQRRGLGIAAPEPLYVTALDPMQNRVVVGTADDVYGRELIASHPLWTMWDALREARTVQAKIRCGKREAAATVIPEGACVRVRFSEPQRAVTPGQSVVFYEDDIVLGGGVIDEVIA